jgi:hypothetical protein
MGALNQIFTASSLETAVFNRIFVLHIFALEYSRGLHGIALGKIYTKDEKIARLLPAT